ncbi:MAG: hypothetical protein IJ403_09485 [Oscillospiraceae bacterium]|nr:hypothetical protein [Oscillospiraceae bacterium]
MHNGEFRGDLAENQKVRVLILGESHYWGEDKKEEDKLTSKVVETYLKKYNSRIRSEKDRSYRFFDNIVQAFGIDPENRTDFWNRVWFGNYIDEPCGVRDSQATKVLKRPGKRDALNKQLFEFIEENKIDIVFCFSRKVYAKLPPLELAGDSEKTGEKSDSHRLDMCVYGAGERKAVSIPLSKSVTVYGLKHPSQGFSYRKYQNLIKKIVQEHGLLF